MPKTRNALRILDREVGDDTQLRALIAKAREDATIAQLIFNVRTQAGLTQSELAKRVGTKQPVIARLEDANYRGQSLTMLHRIARALNYELKVIMVPQSDRRAGTGSQKFVRFGGIDGGRAAKGDRAVRRQRKTVALS